MLTYRLHGEKVGFMLKVTKCHGEGQGSCKGCTDNGKWNRIWTSMLFKIEGMSGCYCSECVHKILSVEVGNNENKGVN